MASPWLRNRASVSGALVAALVVLAGFTSLVYTPHDPEAVEIQLRLKAREAPQTPRFCWHCRKPLHARSDHCPFCGERQ